MKDPMKQTLIQPRPSAASLRAKSLVALLCATGLASAVQAATVGYWRFEAVGILADSGPNNVSLYQFNHPTTGNLNPLPIHYALPATGSGSGFTIGGVNNGHAIQGAGTAQSFNHRQLGADISAFDGNLTSAFTFEAFVNLSFTNAGNTSVLAGQGANATSGASWAIAVSGESASLGTRNIIFQIDPSGGWGGTGFQTLDSNLALELNKDYYLAVTANFSDTSVSGITIYLKDLSDPAAPLQSIGLAHTGTIGASDQPLSLGALSTGGSPWYGLIDEVRISDAALAPQDLLVNQSSIPEPSSFALVAGGVLGLFAAMRRRRA